MLHHLKKKLSNNHGLSLLGTLAALALLGFFTLIAINVLGQIVEFTNTRSTSLDQQSEIESAFFKIQKIAGNGVYLQGTTAPLNAFNLTFINPGRFVTNFDSTALPLNGSVSTLALFYREDARIGNSALRNSVMRPTALFFKQPNISANEPGFLLMDFGLGASLSPGPDDFYFSSIIELKTLDAQILPSQGGVVLLRSIQLEIKFRKYLSGDPSTWVFCPSADMGTAPCITKSQYVDSVKTFRINFRNNFDPNLDSLGMHGRAYFFN